MTTLHLMVGLPGSGKTTYARQLAETEGALRLTPDVWQIRLFGRDQFDPAHDSRHSIIEGIMWDVAKDALSLGVSVILDYGFWAREEREDFRARAAALGVGFRIHYMHAEMEELLARLRARNEDPHEGAFLITEAMMAGYAAAFEPPDARELA